MNILFIDLTDGQGPAKNAVESLQERYGENEIQILRVGRTARIFSETNLSRSAFSWLAPFLALTGVRLNTINSIIIAAHGTIDDITHCYDDNFGRPGAPLLTAEQLATFSSHIFQALDLSPQQITSITLLVCYAARTAHYERDHIAEKNDLDFKETFAFRFSRQLGRELQNSLPIAIRAYIGDVSFKDAKRGNGSHNPEAGNIFCETEGRIALNDRLHEVEAEMSIKEKWIGCLESFCTYNACLPCNESLDRSYQQLRDEKSLIAGMSPAQDYGCVIYTAIGNSVQYDTGELKQAIPPRGGVYV